jgi:hypothetical protein
MQIEKIKLGEELSPCQVYAGNERRQWREANRALLGSGHQSSARS